MKMLSEQLADLSVRAKHAEDAVSEAKKEAQDKIAARREQARADVQAAIDKVDHDLKSAGDSMTRDWNTIRAKVAADVNALKANVALKKHEHDVKRAENRADQMEWEAGFAIDYAAASIEQAAMAVLDAIQARAEAEDAKRVA
jgi:hypothetical protein